MRSTNCPATSRRANRSARSGTTSGNLLHDLLRERRLTPQVGSSTGTGRRWIAAARARRVQLHSAPVRFATGSEQIDAGDRHCLRAVAELQLRLIHVFNRRVHGEASEVARLVLGGPRGQHADVLLHDARSVDDERVGSALMPGNSFSISGVVIATG